VGENAELIQVRDREVRHETHEVESVARDRVADARRRRARGAEPVVNALRVQPIFLLGHDRHLEDEIWRLTHHTVRPMASIGQIERALRGPAPACHARAIVGVIRDVGSASAQLLGHGDALQLVRRVRQLDDEVPVGIFSVVAAPDETFRNRAMAFGATVVATDVWSLCARLGIPILRPEN
jgi:hypothetical protein